MIVQVQRGMKYHKLKSWQKKSYHHPWSCTTTTRFSFTIPKLKRRDQTFKSLLLSPPTNHPKQPAWTLETPL